MRTEEQTYELIERYLENDLEASEKSSFEKELDKDSNLRSQLEEHRQAHLLTKLSGLYELEKKVRNYEPDKKRGKWGSLFGLGFGVIIITTGIICWNYFGSEKNESLKNTTEEIEVQSVEANNEIITVNSVDTAEVEEVEIMTQKNVEIRNHEPIKRGEADVDTSEAEEVIVQEKVVEKELAVDTAKADKTDKPEEKVSQSDPCEKVSITADVQSNPTCRDKAEGSIVLTSIKGGKEPYQFKLNEGNYQRYQLFDQLSEANYQITIRDNDGCITTLEPVTIASKVCEKPFNYTISTSLNQLFEPDFASGKDGQFRVYDATRRLIYTREFNGGIAWDGRLVDGSRLNFGEYYFEVVLDSAEEFLGTITLLP